MMNSLFLITSRQAFSTQIDQLAAGMIGSGAFRVSGKYAPGAGASRSVMETLRAGTSSVVLIDL